MVFIQYVKLLVAKEKLFEVSGWSDVVIALHALYGAGLTAEVFSGSGASCLFTSFLQLLCEMRALSPKMPIHATDCRPARFEA